MPARFVQFKATKGGLTLTGDSTTVSADARYGVDRRTDQVLTVWADETAAVRPLTITGLLLGAVAGWLLTAALAYRVRRTGRSRRRVVAALGAAVFAAAVIPVFALYSDLYQVWIYDSGMSNPYVVDSPSGQLPAGLVPACTGIGLLAFAAAFLAPGNGPAPDPDRTGQEPVVSS